MADAGRRCSGDDSLDSLPHPNWRDRAPRQSLVREAEDFMLRETQEWLMLMRFTKLEAV
jgi:hypothetical protein